MFRSFLAARGGLWRNPDFMRLWAAQSLSAVGARFTREGLPIIAALLLDASATDLGLLVALSALPGVLLNPLQGHGSTGPAADAS